MPVSCFLSANAEFHEHVFCEGCLSNNELGFRKTPLSFRELMRVRDQLRDKKNGALEDKIRALQERLDYVEGKRSESGRKFCMLAENFRVFKESAQEQIDQSKAKVVELERKLVSADSQRDMYKRLYLARDNPVTPRRSTQEAVPSHTPRRSTREAAPSVVTPRPAIFSTKGN